MANSTHIPLSVSAKTPEQLSRKMLEVQLKQGGKCSTIAIYYDPSTKQHIWWYLPVKGLGGGLM